jgi:hypothetical protein
MASSEQVSWQPIEEYYGFYEVSHTGEVRSLPRTITKKNGVTQRLRGRILRRAHHPYGYPTVGLHRRGEQKTFLVHRLVYRAFGGEIPEHLYVCHRDGSQTNNHIDNLYLATNSENQQDAIRGGFRDPKALLGRKNPALSGEKNPMAKLMPEQVMEIKKRRAAGERLINLAEEFGVSFQLISLIGLGKVWSHV